MKLINTLSGVGEEDAVTLMLLPKGTSPGNCIYVCLKNETKRKSKMASVISSGNKQNNNNDVLKIKLIRFNFRLILKIVL
uniref:Uncharacterized protein n=1 Tax=Octopus bimaculoides TaxID=37653 RepID=A0A0L8HI21_OCTBM